jgi:enamine deaminase RidA (YjgF/YER057c/UK114 family)
MDQASPAAKLAALGLVLPPAPAAVADYVPYVQTGALLVVSGQLPFLPDGTIPAHWRGKLGADVALEDAQAAARQCALNCLAQVAAALGGLDRVVRVVRLGGFVNATAEFEAIPAVVNGASTFMATIFGAAGRHARAAVGAAQLPLSACIEVEAMFEVRA